MKKQDYFYQCKIDETGRLYYGAWIHKSVLPHPMPEDEVTFEEFPENANGGADYLWDGQTLTYAPLPEETEEDHAEDPD